MHGDSSTQGGNLLGSARQSAAVDVSSVDWDNSIQGVIPWQPTSILVGTGGNVVGQLVGDAVDVTFPLVAGIQYAMRFKIVRNSGTTAAGIVVMRG